MKRYDARFTVIIALSAIALLLIGLFYIVEKTVTFQIQDKCGRFVNLFSHSISTEVQCETRCEQQCDAKEMRFKKVVFEEIENSCNNCQCTCASFLGW